MLPLVRSPDLVIVFLWMPKLVPAPALVVEAAATSFMLALRRSNLALRLTPRRLEEVEREREECTEVREGARLRESAAARTRA